VLGPDGCAQALIVKRLKRIKSDLANMQLLSTEFAVDPNTG
jgi:hypothetical protein